MDERKRVVLYGNSVVLGCIGASLERGDRFEVLHLSPPLPGRSELEKMAPDVVVFDAETGRPRPAFSLLETRSDLRLLGVSPDGNLIRLWSGCQYRELSAKDVTELIESGSPSADPPA